MKTALCGLVVLYSYGCIPCWVPIKPYGQHLIVHADVWNSSRGVSYMLIKSVYYYNPCISLYVNLDHSSSKGQSKYGGTLYNVDHSSSKGQSKYGGTL